MNTQIEKEIAKIREDILKSYKRNLNDSFTEYDYIIDLVGDYSLEVSELYESYDKYVCSLVNEEYDEISKEQLLSINLEIKNRIDKEYGIDVEFPELETYFLGMFDNAMEEVVGEDNPITVENAFDMIDKWTRELDDYIKSVI